MGFSSYRNTLQLLKLKAMSAKHDKTKLIPLESFGLVFDIDHYTITCENKFIHMPYSPNYGADIELIYQMITYGMDERIFTSETTITDTDGFNVINEDSVIAFIYSKLDEIKYNNLVHWNIDLETVDKLHKISTKITSCIEYRHLDGISSMDLGSLGLFNNAKVGSFIREKFVIPSLLTTTCLLSGDVRKYFISDLLAMSEVKVAYYLKMLDGLVYDGFHNPFMFSIAYCKKKALGTGFMNQAYLEKIHKYIVDNFPNIIDKFPFKSLRYCIPSISTVPTTSFQWLLTNYICKTEYNNDLSFEINTLPYHNSDKEIREHTACLLEYVNADDKAFELYCEHIRVDSDSMFDFFDKIAGMDKKGYLQTAKAFGYTVEELSEYDIQMMGTPNTENFVYEHIRGMLKFIEDGKYLYKMYPTEYQCEGGYVVKLVPVEGTILKEVRNAIYNHNEEKKISVEEKLKLLNTGSKESDFMPCKVELSEHIENMRIKTKRHLIYSGKELEHCIGGKTDSKDLFFRSGTVCAQIGLSNKKFSVSECRDKKNTLTENSTKLKQILEAECVILNEKYKDVNLEEVTQMTTNRYVDHALMRRMMEVHVADTQQRIEEQNEKYDNMVDAMVEQIIGVGVG